MLFSSYQVKKIEASDREWGDDNDDLPRYLDFKEGNDAETADLTE